MIGEKYWRAQWLSPHEPACSTVTYRADNGRNIISIFCRVSISSVGSVSPATYTRVPFKIYHKSHIFSLFRMELQLCLPKNYRQQQRREIFRQIKLFYRRVSQNRRRIFFYDASAADDDCPLLFCSAHSCNVEMIIMSVRYKDIIGLWQRTEIRVFAKRIDVDEFIIPQKARGSSFKKNTIPSREPSLMVKISVSQSLTLSVITFSISSNDLPISLYLKVVF